MGVRRSKMRKCESVETAEMMFGFEGQKDVLYVQLPTGSVLNDSCLAGDHYDGEVSTYPYTKNADHGAAHTILTVPSQELEAKVSFVTGLHATEKVSRLCSWKFMTGNCGTLVS